MQQSQLTTVVKKTLCDHSPCASLEGVKDDVFNMVPDEFHLAKKIESDTSFTITIQIIFSLMNRVTMYPCLGSTKICVQLWCSHPTG